VRIARGGGVIVALAVAVGAGGLILFLYTAAPPAWPALLFLLVPLTALFFFRDPEREPDRSIAPGTALAPADGRVLVFDREEGAWTVQIYLTLFDVHVVRLPLAAQVESCRRSGRGYRSARTPAARANHRLSCVCSGSAGVFEVDLVAGLMARRIVPYLAPGESAERGGRLGLIRFGSRVECRLPAGYRPLCQPGDRIRAGRTPLAEPAADPSEA